MVHVLAQPNNYAGILGWSLVLIVLLLLGAGGVLWLRRWLREDVPSGGLGFTLSDLRQLVREGKMTADEYERARAKMMAGAKAMTDKLPDPLARDGDPLARDRRGPNVRNPDVRRDDDLNPPAA